MNILIKRKVFACSKKACRVNFLLPPLALIPFAYAQATHSVFCLSTRCRTLGDQLRQESVRTPTAPINASLVLPEEEPAGKSLSADNHTKVRVKAVVFTGNLPVLKGLGETDLQQQLITDLNRPQNFAGLEAMAQKITTLYHHNGLLFAQASSSGAMSGWIIRGIRQPGAAW